MLSGLPPKANEAVRLRFIESLNIKDAAQIVGCSIHTLTPF
ncbi:MAG: sigma factor-like helix-turn-helix DNA-binding protein [Planctomycetota bacterium]